MKATKRKKLQIMSALKTTALAVVAAVSPVANPRTGTDEKDLDQTSLMQPQHDEDEDYDEEYQGDEEGGEGDGVSAYRAPARVTPRCWRRKKDGNA